MSATLLAVIPLRTKKSELDWQRQTSPHQFGNFIRQDSIRALVFADTPTTQPEQSISYIISLPAACCLLPCNKK